MENAGKYTFETKEDEIPNNYLILTALSLCYGGTWENGKLTETHEKYREA